MRRHPTASGDSSPKRFNDSFLLFGLLWSTFYVDKNPPGKKGGFLIFTEFFCVAEQNEVSAVPAGTRYITKKKDVESFRDDVDACIYIMLVMCSKITRNHRILFECLIPSKNKFIQEQSTKYYVM